MKMKAILLAAALVLPACAVNADPLPDAYLGRWCYGGYDEDKKAMMYNLVATKKEWKKCREGDGYMEIKRTGYSRHEEDCTFISVKHATKIPKTVPVVRIVAQCGGEGATWRDHIELSFFKKVLQMNQLKQTAEYRHGVSFKIPHGTNMCDEPGDYKESGKACNTAKQVWTVRLWGEPREDWCLIVHWAGVPNKPDLEMAVWKSWVDCKDLIPIANE
jgi:hypothetical protein